MQPPDYISNRELVKEGNFELQDREQSTEVRNVGERARHFKTTGCSHTQSLGFAPRWHAHRGKVNPARSRPHTTVNYAWRWRPKVLRALLLQVNRKRRAVPRYRFVLKHYGKP